MSTQLSVLTQSCLDYGFSDARYRQFFNDALNEAQARFCVEANARTQQTTGTFTTVAGTATQALPDNFLRTIDLSNTDDGIVIPSIELRDYDDMPSTSGKPYAYLIIGTNLTFYPTPDGAYDFRLRYYSLPATMAADTDTPEIPARYEFILIDYAVMKAYERENDFVAANYYSTQYREELEKAKGELAYDTHDSPVQVEGSFSNVGSGPRFSRP